MPKITFMGAGSSTFAKNIIGDAMLSPALRDAHFALYDIDPQRLDESRRMLEALNANVNEGRARFTAHLGAGQRPDALRGAKYVINAIQVGGYKPSTLIDFDIPKKYGLRQTIGDTLGIGGIFRALRTIPAVLDFARDMREHCPDAVILNYTNPMAMITTAFLAHGGVKGVGLDYLSVDPYRPDRFTAHYVLLGSNMLILEGIRLTGIAPGKYFLSAVPLNIPGGNGFPVRAFLMEFEGGIPAELAGDLY